MPENTPITPKKCLGRPPGKRNCKTIGAILSVGQIFTDEIEAAGWDRLFSSKDDRVFAKGFELALKYKRGLPPQEIKHSGSLTHSLSEADRIAALAIATKLASYSQEA
jgi:hypothetical protein